MQREMGRRIDNIRDAWTRILTRVRAHLPMDGAARAVPQGSFSDALRQLYDIDVVERSAAEPSKAPPCIRESAAESMDVRQL